MTTDAVPANAPRWRFPHPLVLMVACIAAATAATWLLPAGEFLRRLDEATGRQVVVAGSYHAVAAAPVDLFQALLSVPRGFIDAASVIATVFLAGGAFTVVERTGALHWAVDRLIQQLGSRSALVIPVVSFVFMTGGALENLQEEVIALVPVLLVLTARLGWPPVVAVAMSAGSAMVGSAFSPVNPFQAGIALKLASLPALSGGLFRSATLALAFTGWVLATMRLARRSARPPVARAAGGADPADTRGFLGLVVLVVAATFGTYVYGVTQLGWGFDELSAVFLAMGIVAGLLGRLGLEGTAEAFAEGFRGMGYAALLIGFARAIYVVLDQGHVVDTIVNGLFTPLATLPVAVAALGMMAVQALVHVPVPSVSGQAVLTMPVLVPLSDLLGLSRQVTVLAYQFGAGLCDMITPTNGALMAVLAAARVDFATWIRFALPLWALLALFGAAAIGVALAIGL